MAITTVGSIAVALMTLVAIQCFWQVDAGKCDTNEPCAHYMDCKQGLVCARTAHSKKNHLDDDKPGNCKCMAQTDYDKKKDLPTDDEHRLTSCWNQFNSPKKCIQYGTCGQMEECGMSRDCSGGLFCRKNPKAAKGTHKYPGQCIDVMDNKDDAPDKGIWDTFPALKKKDFEALDMPVGPTGFLSNEKCHNDNGLWSSIRAVIPKL